MIYLKNITNAYFTDEHQALRMIPASVRVETRADKVDKFTVAEINALHQKY